MFISKYIHISLNAPSIKLVTFLYCFFISNTCHFWHALFQTLQTGHSTASSCAKGAVYAMKSKGSKSREHKMSMDMRTLTRKPQSLVVSHYAAVFRTLALGEQQTVLQSLRQLLTLFKTQQSLWRFLCCGLSRRSQHLIFEALLKKQGIHDKASHAFVGLLVQKNRHFWAKHVILF